MNIQCTIDIVEFVRWSFPKFPGCFIGLTLACRFGNPGVNKVGEETFSIIQLSPPTRKQLLLQGKSYKIFFIDVVNCREDKDMTKLVEKTQAIVDRMKETNYELFDNNKDEALDFVESRLEAFLKYADIVINEQIMRPIGKAAYEGQEYRDKVLSDDESRHCAHENAIAAIDALNRISEKLGLEPFADVDTKDRYAVAEYIGQVVNEMYEMNRSR
jgi:hypothetical protein